MRRLSRIISVASLVIGICSSHLVAESFPTQLSYVGYVAVDDGEKFPSFLDFVSVADAETGIRTLHVYFRLHLGGFDSHEYLVQHFEVTDFDNTSRPLNL